MYAIFENTGTLDPIAFTTFGVNVKQGESPIGFFGTGLKYALAVIARSRLPFFLQPGDGKEYTLHARREDFRGKQFDFLYLQTFGEEPLRLPFTTELGKTWEPWMAFRELESNTRDEGGTSSVWQSHPDPEEGTVRIIVGGAFAAYYSKWMNETFFPSDRADMVSTAWIDFLPTPSQFVYYRGIKALKLSKPSNFTMNVKTEMQLTEDRTIKNIWDLDYWCKLSIVNAKNEGICARALRAKKDTLEHDFDFEHIGSWGADFRRMAEKFYADPQIATLELNTSVLRRLDAEAETRKLPGEADITPAQESIVDLAKDIALAVTGTSLHQFPIVITDQLPDKLLGLAKDNKIFISTRCLDEGVGQTAGTIIEEWIHLRHGYRDYSREFQDFLLRKLVHFAGEALGHHVEAQADMIPSMPVKDWAATVDEIPF